MPLEGHYRRVNTPLRKLTGRERRVLIWGTAVTAIALLVLILATAGDSRPAPAPGCIRASVAGRTGAELVQACGEEAVSTCRRAQGFEGSAGPAGAAILDACTEAGIRF
jgi:hypothetical protein